MIYRTIKSTYWRIVDMAKKPLIKKPETPRASLRPVVPTPVDPEAGWVMYSCWNCGASGRAPSKPAQCPACDQPSR